MARATIVRLGGSQMLDLRELRLPMYNPHDDELTDLQRGFAGDFVMGRAGFEPATLGLKVPCSTS